MGMFVVLFAVFSISPAEIGKKGIAELNSVVAAELNVPLTNPIVNEITNELAKAAVKFVSSHSLMESLVTVCNQNVSQITQSNAKDSCNLEQAMQNIGEMMQQDEFVQRTIQKLLYRAAVRNAKSENGSVLEASDFLMSIRKKQTAPSGTGTRPGVFSPHPFTVAKDQFLVLTLWALMWSWGAGERLGYRFGLVQQGYNDEPLHSQIRIIKGVSVTRWVEWDVRDLVKKWRAIHTLFPTFDRWYEVYSKEATGLANVGGVKKLCRDFLPSIYPRFDFHTVEKAPFATTDGNCIGDVDGVFTLSPASPAARDLAEKALKIALEHPDQPAPNLVEIEKVRLVKQFEKVKEYFLNEKAVSRIPLMFSDNPNIRVPKEDLEMCWAIMDAATETVDFSSPEHDQLANIIKLPDHWLKGYDWLLDIFHELVVRAMILPFSNLFFVYLCFRLALRNFSGVFLVPQASDDQVSDNLKLPKSLNDWTCNATPSAGEQSHVCLRHCAHSAANDHRIRHSVMCSISGMFTPPVDKVIANNDCETASGIYPFLDMAYLTK
eukprot:c2497_g1_i1.p1 GENE.c2497_g1_i1~~c2497_g1_i1.p1  ORF type:complete len:555 (+),score=166.96 c2497_g1_i1:24-1667(+)